MTEHNIVTMDDVHLILDNFEDVGTYRPHIEHHKGFIEDNLGEEALWGWIVAHFWMTHNLATLADQHQETLNYTWQVAFTGSLEALRAAVELYEQP